MPGFERGSPVQSTDALPTRPPRRATEKVTVDVKDFSVVNGFCIKIIPSHLLLLRSLSRFCPTVDQCEHSKMKCLSKHLNIIQNKIFKSVKFEEFKAIKLSTSSTGYITISI